MADFYYRDSATPLDLDDVEGLLITHITTRAELDRWEQDNIVEALTWLDKAKPKDVLSEQFAKELHRRMFGDVWKWAGTFRRTNKNIGVPWQHVPMSLKSLCDDARLWIEKQNEPVDILAVRFHHRLVSIHLFPNGNGRHGRLMTDILLENVLASERFSWGGKDLTKAGELRSEYIRSLHEADKGELEFLRRFARS